MVSPFPRLSWGGLTSSSLSLRPFHVIFFEGWPSLFFPVPDGLLVPLIRPALWLLQTLPQGFEQTTHVSRMIAHSKLPSDHYSHPLAGPYLSSKAVSLSSPFQKLGHLGALLLAQTRPCSRGGSAL